MQVAVWDTYVIRKDGLVMHFDIIAPTAIKDPQVIHEYVKQYLETKGQDGQDLTSNECRFCHTELVKPEWEDSINQKGYFIFEMKNCH